MKKLKKSLCVLTIICMVLSMFPAAVLASPDSESGDYADEELTRAVSASGTAQTVISSVYGTGTITVGTGGDYTDPGWAIYEAPDGSTIELLEPISYSGPIEVDGKDITLKLGDYDLDVVFASGPALKVTNGGSLSLEETGIGQFNVTSLNGNGMSVLGGSSATVTNATGNGARSRGAWAAGTGSRITIKGNAAASGNGSYGAFADGGCEITVSGDVTAHGDNDSAGVFANGGKITVEGNIEAIGARSAGVTSVNGNITVNGDVVVDGPTYPSTGECAGGAFAIDGGLVSIRGNVTISSSTATMPFYGVAAGGSGSVAYIYGDIMVNGYGPGVGASVSKGGNVFTEGNITAATGAEAGLEFLSSGGVSTDVNLIYVSGIIDADKDYINVGDVIKTSADGVDGTGDYSGYKVYTETNERGTHKVVVQIPVMNADTGKDYPTLYDALNEASDGETIKLLKDISDSTVYFASTDKTITIDGQGYILTGTAAYALDLSGEGVVILKDITLHGGKAPMGISCGLNVTGKVSVQSIGIVKALGGSGTYSYGLDTSTSGVVNITEASAGLATEYSYGVNNRDDTTGGGNVNVKIVKGGTGAISFGIFNYGSKTVNVTTANGGAGMQTEAVHNMGTGTVNVNSANGSKYSVYNYSTGIVNVADLTGPIEEGSGTVNTGSDVANITLNRGAGAICILDTVTVAAAGTAAETLPSVYKDGVWGEWFTDSARTTLYAGGSIANGANLYSTLYEAPISTPAISGIAAPKTGAVPTATISATPEYTATISWSPAASTFAASKVYTATIIITPKAGYSLKGVPANFFTVAGATTTNAADSGVVTAVFPATAAATSSEGSGRGGSTSSATTQPAQLTAPTVTNSTGNTAPSVTGTIMTEAKSDSTGQAIAALSEGQVADAIAKAAEAAAKQGTGTALKIDIKITAPTDAKTVETNLPKAALTKVAEGNISALTVSTPVAAITFDQAAINTISKEASADVKITASKVENASLSEEAKAVVGNRPVFNFSVTSGDKVISQFGGNVSVAVPYTPKAGEDTNAIVIYFINAKGKPEMVSNCAYDPASGTIRFTTNHFSQYAVGYNKVSFRDIAADAWYSKAVSFVAARGITVGTGDGNYDPEGKLTRGEFITMVMRAYGMNPDENLKDNFADAGKTYYTSYLAAAKRMGITNGIGNNMFAPEKEITRQEMFTLLYNTLKQLGELPSAATGRTLASYSDSGEIASFAMDAMTLFVGTGTISGSNGNLNPSGTTNRAQMAQALYNLLTK